MKLNIPNDSSKGLSHAIDAKLDADFKAQYGIEDVDLSGHWQSIFDAIKADQAEQEAGQRKFGEKDKDVTKGSHYKVNSGNYIIKEDVWKQIVNKAKEVMGVKDTPQTQAPANPDATVAAKTQSKVTAAETPKSQAPVNPTPPETPKAPQAGATETPTEQDNKPLAESVEAKAAKILADAKIDTTGIDMDAVNKKYEELLNAKDKDGKPLDEAIINQRIKNFAILQRKESYATAEKRFDEMAKQYPTKEDFRKGNAKSLLKQSTDQFNDENSKYVDAEIAEAMESNDMEKYKSALHNFGKARLSEVDSNNDGTISRKEFRKFERDSGNKKITRSNMRNRFDYLDVNGDNKIDEKEVTAYYYAMSKCKDGENDRTGDDITFGEYMTAQQAVSVAGEKSMTEKEKEVYDTFTAWRNEGYKNL